MFIIDDPVLPICELQFHDHREKTKLTALRKGPTDKAEDVVDSVESTLYPINAYLFFGPPIPLCGSRGGSSFPGGLSVE